MDKAEVLAMKPGTDLNRLVRKVVFGVENPTIWPRYSENIEAAFEVVEKMREYQRYASIINLPDSGKYAVNFVKRMQPGSNDTLAIGTAPHAICLAALLALEVEREQG